MFFRISINENPGVQQIGILLLHYYPLQSFIMPMGRESDKVTRVKEESCLTRDIGRRGKSETKRARGQKLGLSMLQSNGLINQAQIRGLVRINPRQKTCRLKQRASSRES